MFRRLPSRQRANFTARLAPATSCPRHHSSARLTPAPSPPRRGCPAAISALLACALSAACSFDPHGIDQGAADADLGRTPDAAPRLQCPPSYARSSVTFTYFRLVSDSRTWFDAEKRCEEDGPGIHLAVVESPSELSWLDSFVASDSAWLGVTDLVQEGTFRSVLDVVALFLPWDSGEPNDFFAEDCIELAGAKYNDEDCDTKLAYVCECDGLTPVPAAFPKP